MITFRTMRVSILVAFLLVTATIVEGANVLMFLTIIPPSMKVVHLSIAKEMVNRNHTVTVVTSLASEKPLPGIKEIILHDVKKVMFRLADKLPLGVDPTPVYTPASVSNFKNAITVSCESIFASKEIQGILEGKEKYDLVMINLLFDDCALAVAEKLNLPFLYVSSIGFPPEHSNNLRVPSCMPFCPMFKMYDYTDDMTFTQRLKNSLAAVAVTGLREWVLAPVADEIIQKRLGSFPSIMDIEKNVSLVLLNDHFSLTYARPFLPNIVQVPCMYCRPAKPLPKDLQEWVDGSGDAGFIYFALGSFLQDHKMPQHLIDVFVEVFSNIKQRVVWKIGLDSIPNLPSNVRLFKWLPQQDLLGHPKIKLFLNHGGMLSMQEATYHGVPIIGFPTSIDGPYNIRTVEKAGAGMLMSWTDVTTETLQSAVNHVISDTRFKKNAETRREVFRDLPMPPLDTALYWIEYVIRHKGAPQLRTGGLNLSWFQYYQFDILLFLGIIAITILLLLYKIWVSCCNVCRRFTQPIKKKSKME